MVGYFLQAVAGVFGLLIQIAIFAVVARAILSWVSPDPYNPIVKLIYQITDPMLRPFYRWVPPFYGIDWTPIVLLMVLYFVDAFVVQSLARFSHNFL
ncbi:MAG: YggT family protein [Mariprofundaceae bacterium]|nr:YggT family protein [Mariprofundaceae bacterium]